MVRPSGEDDIVFHVARVFRANGFHGTTLSAISKRTGLGRSSLYHHFGQGKLEMALRSLDAIEAFIAERIEAEAEGPEPIEVRWQRIEAALRAHYEGGQLGCLLAVFAIEDVPAEVAEQTKAIFVRWSAAVARLYRSAGVPEAEAASQALRDIVRLQGSLVLSQALSCNEPFDQALAQISGSISERFAGTTPGASRLGGKCRRPAEPG